MDEKSFAHEPPVWQAEGQAPEAGLAAAGWQPGQKPTAGVFNWFFGRVSRCLEELQGRVLEDEETLAGKQDSLLTWKYLPAASGVMGTVQYALDQRNWVHLKGSAFALNGSGLARGTVLGTLPAGYRPTLQTSVIVTLSPTVGGAESADPCVVLIGSDGVVRLAKTQLQGDLATGQVRMDGAQFPVK